MFPMPNTKRPGEETSASCAAETWSGEDRPCDQSTLVVTPDSIASSAEMRLPAA